MERVPWRKPLPLCQPHLFATLGHLGTEPGRLSPQANPGSHRTVAKTADPRDPDARSERKLRHATLPVAMPGVEHCRLGLLRRHHHPPGSRATQRQGTQLTDAGRQVRFKPIPLVHPVADCAVGCDCRDRAGSVRVRADCTHPARGRPRVLRPAFPGHPRGWRGDGVRRSRLGRLSADVLHDQQRRQRHFRCRQPKLQLRVPGTADVPVVFVLCPSVRGGNHLRGDLRRLSHSSHGQVGHRLRRRGNDRREPPTGLPVRVRTGIAGLEGTAAQGQSAGREAGHGRHEARGRE